MTEVCSNIVGNSYYERGLNLWSRNLDIGCRLWQDTAKDAVDGAEGKAEEVKVCHLSDRCQSAADANSNRYGDTI